MLYKNKKIKFFLLGKGVSFFFSGLSFLCSTLSLVLMLVWRGVLQLQTSTWFSLVGGGLIIQMDVVRAPRV